MKRSRLLARVAAAVATMAMLVPLAAPAGADEALTVVSADAGSYPDVRMVVAAPAQLGDQTLTDGAFRVVEGGQARAVHVEALPADQLEVSLVIDTSGSMAGAPLAAAKTAAQSLLSQLPATVPVSVVGFGATAKVVSARSSNRTAQAAAIAGLTAGGQTALYDALGGALAQLPAGSGSRRMIVLLTDGGDTASKTTLDATTGALGAAHVALFAVELRTSESNPAALGQLTAASGGRVVPASDPAALAAAFDAVAKQLVRQYALTYTSQASGGADVDVILETPGLRATARRHLDLPAAPAASASVPAAGAAPAPAVPAATSSSLGSWALILGSGLCGLGVLGLSLWFFGSRTPRARGLAVTRRRVGLAEAAQRAEALGDSLLRHRGGAAALGAALDAAGVDLRAGEVLVLLGAGAVVALAAGWALVGPLVGLVLGTLVVVAGRITLDVLGRRRRRQFADQLPETLQILAGSLRAGHGLAQGLDTVSREAESPTADEFRRLTIETRLGRDLVDAMSAVTERVRSEDFRWVVQAIDIQREVGGDLAEVLDNVGGTIRDRTRIRRQVSALSAEGRLSAVVLMVLPFGLAAVMSVTNRSYLGPLYQSNTGHVLLAVAAVLLAAGGVWLRRIVKPIF